MVSHFLFASVFFFCSFQAVFGRLETEQPNWTVGQTVLTSSGSVVGHAAPNATEVSEYLGIRFARPPLGSLRFARPLPYTSNDTFNASSFGPACLIVSRTAQSTASTGPTVNVNFTTAGNLTSYENGEINVQRDEDCLSLNVWTKPQVGEFKKAVMLWIYGGAFTEENSNNPLYNGEYLAYREDVVVITINYRVNIFGFPGSPAGPQAQNVGLLDQRLAIEWVRDNIAEFGGDPKRITLFGQSAGAQSIDIYTYAYINDPIVSAFIQESGTTSLLPALNSTASAAMWYNVTATVGCGSSTSNSTEVLDCMCNADSSSILDALGSQNFIPTIDNTLVFSDYQSRSQAGQFIRKPLLLGNNDNEGSIFRIQDLEENIPFTESLDNYNLRRWTCPAAVRANASVAKGVPTWRYRWFGVYPNTNLTTDPDSGAYHGSEIPIIFNTPPVGLGSLPDTPQKKQTVTYVQSAWAAFAKDPINGLERFGWPRYDPAGDTLLELGLDNAPGVNTSPPQVYDTECESIGFLFPVNAMNVTCGGTESIGAETDGVA